MNTIYGGDGGHQKGKLVFGDGPNDRKLYRATVLDGRYELPGKQNTDMIIEYDSKEYTIGTSKGRFSVEDDKSKDEVFKLSLISGLVSTMRRDIENINLVTGLPINYYKKYREALKRSLEDTTVKVGYKGTTKILNFCNVLVIPESVGLPAVHGDKFKGNNLVIDIGSRTVDVSYFEGQELTEAHSYDLGMLTVYGKIVSNINNKYGTDYKPLDAERIIEEGTITVDNTEVTFDAARFLKSHTENILNPIKLDFPWKTSKKTFIGGGSLSLQLWLPKSHIQCDKIFANAEAFYRIGVDQFGS